MRGLFSEWGEDFNSTRVSDLISNPWHFVLRTPQLTAAVNAAVRQTEPRASISLECVCIWFGLQYAMWPGCEMLYFHNRQTEPPAAISEGQLILNENVHQIMMSKAAIRGRLVQESLMRNGLCMYQVEKESLVFFFFFFLKLHFHARTTLETVLNMKGWDSTVLSWIRLFCPHQLGDLCAGRNLLF